jgi:hypothetical protein
MTNTQILDQNGMNVNELFERSPNYGRLEFLLIASKHWDNHE